MRLKFCHHFEEILTENPDLPNKLLMRDEAYFHLNGTVNKQNFRNWSAAIPHELHQTPLYDPKVTIWCAVWSRGVIGTYFFEDEDGQAITVTSQRYTEMINEFLSPNLPPNNVRNAKGYHKRLELLDKGCNGNDYLCCYYISSLYITGIKEASIPKVMNKVCRYSEKGYELGNIHVCVSKG